MTMDDQVRSCCWILLNGHLVQLLYVVSAQLQLGVDCAAPSRHGLWQAGQRQCGYKAVA